MVETIEKESTTVRSNFMTGKYNTFNEDDIPEDLREILTPEQEEIAGKLVLPKKVVENQYQRDQLDALRKAMEYERKRFEQHDPVVRELRELRNEVEYLKNAMRRIGVLLDTDLPDEKMFEEFKMLREAFKKYKMVEKLVLGEDK